MGWRVGSHEQEVQMEVQNQNLAVQLPGHTLASHRAGDSALPEPEPCQA
jgi:hypothetical protein